ncbi:MAG: hypothetical protein ACREEP_02610, partial [Dongiaceae bacterium]
MKKTSSAPSMPTPRLCDNPAPAISAGAASWLDHPGGILPEIAEIVGLPRRSGEVEPDDQTRSETPARVRYVEDKRPDRRRVQEILELSARARHWANSGPVSLALERVLEHLMRLPADRAVVVCASATVGLSALAGLNAVKLGRRPRWA